MDNADFIKLNEENSIADFKESIRNRNVILFGCGKLGEKMLQYLRCCNKDVIAVVDNDKAKQGRRWHGYRIQDLEDLNDLYVNAIFVVVSIYHYEEMAYQLFTYGIERNNIVICAESQPIVEAIIRSGKYADGDKFFHFLIPVPISLWQFCKDMGDKVRSFCYKILMSFSKPQKVQYQKKFNVSICAIFKNEAAYLAEWIEYHRIVGVEHFYLYNNFSSDNYLEILEPYIKSGLITLIDWPMKQGQISAYQDCFDNFSNESQWIGLIDIDEFVTPIKTDGIYTVLSSFEKKRGAVLFYWKIFTSSAIVHRDISNLVIEDFTVCISKHYNVGKCFVNTSYFPVKSKKNFLIHHEAWTSIGKRALPPVNASDKIAFYNRRQRVSNEAFSIQINHYILKSYDEYVERSNKGDVFFKKSYRTDAHFAKIDRLGDAEDKSAYRYLAELKHQLNRE